MVKKKFDGLSLKASYGWMQEYKKAGSFRGLRTVKFRMMMNGMCDHYKVPCQTLGPDRKLRKHVIKGFSTDLFADAAIGYLNSYAIRSREN